MIHGLGKNKFNAGLPQCNMKLKVDFRTEQGLKRSNELELFRRLEKLSSKPAKQINYDGVIDFLLHVLCQNPALLKATKRNTKSGGDPPNSLPEMSSGKTG